MEADKSFEFARTKENFMDLQNLTTECLNSEHEISNAAQIGITNYENKHELCQGCPRVICKSGKKAIFTLL